MSEGETNEQKNELKIDEYDLVNLVASGNHTEVWEVRNGTATLAMKLLLPDALKDYTQRATLKREARVARSLEHPNLVHFHKIVVTKKHGYIIMDFFRGGNLKSQIGSDLVSVQSRIRKLIDGICLALGYMHDNGWVHKDIKPDNILFNKSSELKLIDYSLSKRGATTFTRMFHSKRRATIQGTRTYIAPETLMRKPETPQTDMYSLGITLFEVLTGMVPFTGVSPAELLRKHVTEIPPEPSVINKNVTPEMDRFVMRLLAKSPKKRPKTMEEIHAEFRSIQPFKEDVVELAARRQEEAHRKQLASLDQAQRLDSRDDHLKSSLKKQESPEQGSKPAPPPKAPPQPAASAPAPAPPQSQPAQHPQRPPQPQQPGQPYQPQQPPAPVPPGMQQPGQPGQPYPGQPAPGMMPGQPIPPPGYPPPPGMPPGYHPQGAPPQPGAPQQPYPQPPHPQQTHSQQPGPAPAPPPQQPPPGQPQAPAPAAPAPAAQQPPLPQEPQQPAPQNDDEKKKKQDEELPYMDELPDVL